MLAWKKPMFAGALLLLCFNYAVIQWDLLKSCNCTCNCSSEVEAEAIAWSRTLDSEREPLWSKTLDFDALGFSNETGSPTGEYLVPNFVHFIHFGGRPLTYVQLICALSAFKNQRPDRLYIHYDNNNTFSGKYGEALLATPGIHDVMILNRIDMPTEVYGQPLSEKWRICHASDITRIRVGMQYGGIYLDTDCYTVRSLNNLRRYEMVLGLVDYGNIGSMVFMAHKDARFLRRWIEGYREYDASRYYWNVGEKPAKEVLGIEPHVIHLVKDYEFASVYAHQNSYYMERMNEEKLHSRYVLHLLSKWAFNVRTISGSIEQSIAFDENNIANYPVTIRDLAYDVYDTAGVDWPKEYPEEHMTDPEEQSVDPEEHMTDPEEQSVDPEEASQ